MATYSHQTPIRRTYLTNTSNLYSLTITAPFHLFHHASRPESNETISDIHISPRDIVRIIKKLKLNSAAGPDRLPPIFFKNTTNNIAFPLTIIFQSFIDLQQLPNEWKHSIITPKFKKGQTSSPANYRPIALTCTCCKILESIISSALTEFLLIHNLISKQQHGFLKRHSTATNLLESLNDWTLSFANKQTTIVAYIDFQRAFDSISHSKLIHKLMSYGISGNLLYWIQSFLTHRTQSVRVGSCLSNSCSVSSGVPQGSVLGPLLFLLFINDISDPFGNEISSELFADDIKIYTVLTHPDSFLNFQKHLDSIHLWSSLWQLPISHSKSNCFEISSRPTLISSTTFNISGFPLTSISSVIDLGIRFDRNLKFSVHINETITRANQRAHLIFRSFLSKNATSLIHAYKTYVRPLLEYNTTVWSPSLVGPITALEGVQRHFTKRLVGFDSLSYAERLTKSNLQSLEHRRLMSDLIACFNIVHGYSALCFNDFFSFSHNPSSRGHPLRLSIPLSKTNTDKHFFSNRVVIPWNSLPADLVTTTCPKSFKNQLGKINLSKFLIFPTI